MSARKAEMILEVVRGQRSWKDLGQLGISIRGDGDEYTVENASGIHARAIAKDVAAGLLRFRDAQSDLTEWAKILLIGSSFLELDVEATAEGESLLSSLWDLSFGKPIREEAFELALRVVNEDSE